MRILAIERGVEGGDAARISALLRDEAMAVYQLYQEGTVRELFFRPDTHEAVLLLECADAAAASTALTTLPLVRQGLIAFDVIPLVPYDGFTRLFDCGATDAKDPC